MVISELTLLGTMAAFTLASPSKETFSFSANAVRQIASSTPTIPLGSIREQLTILLNNENVGDFIFKPTIHAFDNAGRRLLKAQYIMGKSFFEPSIVSDGEGGIEIEWVKGDYQVLIACRAEPNKQDYIYYQTEDEYNGEDFSFPYLIDRLEWLIHND